MRARAAPGAAVPGLARRGQALADRQLQLLEDLVRDEPDPQRRQGLLGVDHLATRLRRTAETLLAVTGPGPARRSTWSTCWPSCSTTRWPAHRRPRPP
jgi:hypothetical protein